MVSLRGRRLKGKGKGGLGARERRFPRAQNPLALPFQTPAKQASMWFNFHTLYFLYKNIFHKNIEAEICEILRIVQE